MNATDVAIRLTHVSKKYEIHHEKPTLVEKFTKGKNETFWALNDINLTIQKGERVGIIGPNGSGKTTLLKIIAGITTPTTGTIKTNGKIVSLIDLEAGFHSDLTGYQNIFIHGLLLGMKKSKIHAKIKDIIDFADIKQFIDAPLFTYSSGMKLRLGFSILVYSNPDILLLDEHFGVGDLNFQIKSKEKITMLINRGATIIYISHNLEALVAACSRLILLSCGSILHDVSPKHVYKYVYEKQKPATRTY